MMWFFAILKIGAFLLNRLSKTAWRSLERNRRIENARPRKRWFKPVLAHPVAISHPPKVFLPIGRHRGGIEQIARVQLLCKRQVYNTRLRRFINHTLPNPYRIKAKPVKNRIALWQGMSKFGQSWQRTIKKRNDFLAEANLFLYFCIYRTSRFSHAFLVNPFK